MKEQLEFFDKDKEVFVCYLDEENKATNGYFKILQLAGSLLIIGSDKNILGIPLSRVLKIKQKVEGGINDTRI